MLGGGGGVIPAWDVGDACTHTSMLYPQSRFVTLELKQRGPTSARLPRAGGKVPDEEPDAAPDAEPEADPELDAEPDAELDAEPDADPDTEPEPDPDAEPDADPGPEPNADPEPSSRSFILLSDSEEPDPEVASARGIASLKPSSPGRRVVEAGGAARSRRRSKRAPIMTKF